MIGVVPVVRLGQKTARRGSIPATDNGVILFTKMMAGGYDVQDFACGL